MMYTKTLPGNTESVLKKLSGSKIIDDFYLTGGTALSLQIGHRESQDLDFFSKESFQPEKIQIELKKLSSLESIELSSGTLNCFLDNVKLQFLYYPYILLEKEIEWENVHISSKIDIACTKLITISARGSKKDFIDLYYLLKEFTLSDLFEKLAQKYPNVNYNETHILKSLVYFADADEQPTPRMQKEIDWQQIKEVIIKNTKNFKL